MQDDVILKCSECGAICRPDEAVLIDDAPICRRCLFADTPALTVYPIGIVSNTPQGADRNAAGSRVHGTSLIRLFPAQKHFMHKLEEETCLTIVYYLHKPHPIRARFKRGLDGKEVGVFASRTPARINPIGIQDVRLLKINGTELTVQGLDAYDGTPVLDIKVCRRPR